MTTLAAIPHHHLALDCACGHWALVPVPALAERYGPETDVDEVQRRARCGECGRIGAEAVQIIWKGADDAMDGAGVKPTEPPT
ncbi:hypothetical protein [Tropicimonas sp. IMCC34011]|uniref:hypothetical protein n=1 Tax=Tropicimonas sp. IMCC34011 TaxID=2248759 RepID=UPI000E257CB9|nr:hypothetical protein [Tropicimonas sp. IMCC34011]